MRTELETEDPKERDCFQDIVVEGMVTEGTAVAQWLRCCATNRKVAGSIPACVIGIFH